jgi:hypothetical protein
VRIVTGDIINVGSSGKTTTTYLTCYICNGARRDFLHLDDLRHMCFHLLARKNSLCASVIFDDVGTITTARNFLCGRRRRKYRFEGL